jgi:mono/diheme cytochrome c family protein
MPFFPFDLPFHFARAGVAGAIALAAVGPARAEETKPPPGAAIYRKLCADCHGDKGQGVPEKYDEPLHGNRSVESLAKRIARTMPEDDVGACVGEDAAQVAAYIFDAFYSPRAQARLRPPEHDLARLTIAQHRTSAADLIGSLRGSHERGKERGLRAEYRGFGHEPGRVKTPGDKRVDSDERRAKRPRASFDRVDPQIAFHFGEASPDPDRMDADEFNVRWEASLWAEETGVYEFTIKTENGARLWVNDLEKNLIDAWVSPGPEVREEKKTIFLLGGRAYPLALEFFKFKDKTASIELHWKPPHGVPARIPREVLAPDAAREVMVVRAAFPPDDRSVGYERGTGISKAWEQATTEAAMEVAEHVEAHLEELAGVKADAPDRVERLQRFARRFAETAFRRPLSEEDHRRCIEPHFATAKSPELAVKRVVLFALKSPRFLFPELTHDAQPDGYDVAARLALALWDSLPDGELLRAAAQGRLRSREQIAAQAARMLGDARARSKLRGFFHHWLELDRAESMSKDPKAFPGFDAAVIADLRTSLDRFLEEIVWSERSDYRELLQAAWLPLNGRLGKLYGKEVAGEGFERVAFDPQQRAGVVTHPYLLAALAYSRQTSPIHRGVFLTRNIVGMRLKPPPEAVAFEDAKFDPSLTMREKVTALTRNVSCLGCHATINPLGFSLENYDAIGRWRTRDNDKPVNAVTEFATDEGDTIRLTGARDVVKFAAENAGGHRAFIHHLFHHTVKQAVATYGPDTLEELRAAFAESGFHIQRLLAEIATTAAMRGMPEAAAKVVQR